MGCGPTLYLFKHQRRLLTVLSTLVERLENNKTTTPLPTQRCFSRHACKFANTIKTCQHTWKSIGKYIPMLFWATVAGWFLAGSFKLRVKFTSCKIAEHHGTGRSQSWHSFQDGVTFQGLGHAKKMALLSMKYRLFNTDPYWFNPHITGQDFILYPKQPGALFPSFILGEFWGMGWQNPCWPKSPACHFSLAQA